MILARMGELRSSASDLRTLPERVILLPPSSQSEYKGDSTPFGRWKFEGLCGGEMGKELISGVRLNKQKRESEVGSIPTRLRHPTRQPLEIQGLPFFCAPSMGAD